MARRRIKTAGVEAAEAALSGYRRLLCLVAAVTLVMVPPGRGDADWTGSAKVSQSARYDDNIFLSPTAPIATFGFITEPELQLESRTPDTELSLTARLSYNAFSNSAVRDSFDQVFRGVAVHHTRRSMIGASAEFDRQTSRTSEIIDTGRISANARRQRINAAPYWSVEISPVDRVVLAADLTGVTYDTAALSDFRSYGLQTIWVRDLTMVDELNVSLGASRFEVDDSSDLVSHLGTAKVSITHRVSERLEFNAGAGVRYVTSDFKAFNGVALVDQQSASFGYLVDAGIDYRQSDQLRFNASYSRSVTPSGAGRLQERDSVDFSLIYRLMETVTTDVLGRVIRQGDADRGGDDRLYFEIEPRLRWEVLPKWYLSASYRYRSQDLGQNLGQDLGGTGARASSNSVMMSLTYKAPLW